MDNKTFIEELSRRLDLSRETVGNLIDTFSNTLGKCASEMEGLAVPNFGVFEPRKRPERIALHPASGKRLLVPPRISLVFKTSPALKQKINNGK